MFRNNVLKKSKSFSRVIENFFHLGTLQVLNYLLPLFTMPYLIRTIGIEGVGSLNFALTIIVYIQLFVDYGFNLTATKELSQRKQNKDCVNEIFSSVTLIKFAFLLLSLSIYSLLIGSVEMLRDNLVLYFGTFGIALGYTFFPVWFFHGMQEMKYVTILNVCSKIFYTGMIFFLIKNNEDLTYIPLISSVSSLAIAVCSLGIIYQKYKISFSIPNWAVLQNYIFAGKNVFLQQLFSKFYGPINVILLGSILGNLEVGVFTIAEIIVSIPIMVVTMAAQAYFPHAVGVYSKDKIKYFNQVKKFCVGSFIYSVIVILCSYLLSEPVLDWFIGDDNMQIYGVYEILIVGVFFSVFSQLITQVYVTIDQAKILLKISFITMVLNFILAPWVIVNWGVQGLAILTISRQAFVISLSSCLLFFFIKKDLMLNNY